MPSEYAKMSEPVEREPSPLNVPRAERAQFKRNFIKQAVCELRFPTLFELEQQPPQKFGRAIRREFPTYQLQRNLNLNPGTIDSANVHTFVSRNRTWAVALRSSSLTLETTTYSSFATFLSKFELMLDAAKGFVDSDFFTRVGVRYINAVPCSEGLAWLNPALVGPLASGAFGDPSEYASTIRGTVQEGGGFLFRHGFAPPDANSYVLDFDFFREDVDIAAAQATFEALHASMFDLFWWSLGDAARSYLRDTV
jgi:uncharacterized protein (TIGR04255 family)